MYVILYGIFDCLFILGVMIYKLEICFRIEFSVKKEGWGGGGFRVIKFYRFLQFSDIVIFKFLGKIFNVFIGLGLFKDSRECYILIFLLENGFIRYVIKCFLFIKVYDIQVFFKDLWKKLRYNKIDYILYINIYRINN